MSTLNVIVYVGVFVFAWTGALKARAFHMDIFGGLVMAFVMALGGGTMRDLLIGVRPVSWVNDNLAMLLILMATIGAFLFRRKKVLKYKSLILLFDSFGLGLYTYIGIKTCYNLHITNSVSIVVMGVVTASFGGFIADIITNTVPSLLKRGELYATASGIGGTVYVVLHNYFDANDRWNIALCVILVFSIRMISKWKRVFLPEI